MNTEIPRPPFREAVVSCGVPLALNIEALVIMNADEMSAHCDICDFSTD
jgi:hypothetical protein